MIKTERRYRSILKTVSWRIFATMTTITIVYLFTERIVLSLEIGMVEVVSKMILYYFHERVWNLVTLGKWNHPLSYIKIDKELNEKDKEIILNSLKELGYIE
ncbi:MAG: DUF2061 domain-containing protein [Deltaproteobacteria bacterium]|uniref:DUF2061 domain-containing protein n=1 Tax=Candidatus Zymogenus saltonus TaxID=2844893 RepID=A0A9D8PP51_9DELT|nr:DUF2061 domain-containing protein [Candidatus Zymogenus saltonus]